MSPSLNAKNTTILKSLKYEAKLYKNCTKLMHMYALQLTPQVCKIRN
jgi:hypothetical protein